MNLMVFQHISYQGDQNSPGVIPLAIKDVFSIIQDVSLLGFLYVFRFDTVGCISNTTVELIYVP